MSAPADSPARTPPLETIPGPGSFLWAVLSPDVALRPPHPPAERDRPAPPERRGA